MTLPSLFRRATRRAITAALAADPRTRAEVAEALVNQSVSTMTLHGAALHFYAPSSLLRQRAENILEKEPDTIAWLDAVQETDVLWDVGANVGVFSLYAARHRRCRVLSFEPSAANFHVLTRNVQLNALADLITAYCVALAGETSIGVLNLDSAEPGAAMSQFGQSGEASRYSSRRQPLTHGMIGFTVDEFMRRFNPPAPTRLKLDVDGLEWPILQGAKATLSDARLRSAMIELSVTQREERDRAVAWLADCGLSLAAQGAPQGAAGEQAANHLFVRQ